MSGVFVFLMHPGGEPITEEARRRFDISARRNELPLLSRPDWTRSSVAGRLEQREETMTHERIEGSGSARRHTPPVLRDEGRVAARTLGSDPITPKESIDMMGFDDAG